MRPDTFRMHTILALALSFLLSGCAAPSSPSGDAGAAAVPTARPAAGGAPLAAPAFRLDGAIAHAAPGAAGEPGIVAGPDGALFVAFPGCDGGRALDAVASAGPTCDAGVVYARAATAGSAWARLNDEHGRLAPQAPAANGDVDLAVDEAGTILVANLGGGVHAQRSTDGGRSWTYVGDLVPKGFTRPDREWLAAGRAGHFVVAWSGPGADGKGRHVLVRSTGDAGGSWSDVAVVGASIGWLGRPVFLDASTILVPFTERPVAAGLLHAPTPFDCPIEVAVSRDAGATWGVVDTLARAHVAATSQHFSCLLEVPSVAVTDDGHAVLAWSEERTDPAGAAVDGSRVRIVASADGGRTWGSPRDVSDAPNAIFPWVAGLSGDRAAIAYLRSIVPGDPDRMGRWDLVVSVVAEAGPIVSTVVDRDVHVGGVCSGGAGCLAPVEDRSLGDFLQVCAVAGGALAVAYAADPLDEGRAMEIRVAQGSVK